MPPADDQPTVITGRAPMEASEQAEPELAPVKVGPGSLLGHFELIEPIGGGGMGRVFRAADTRLGRIVALKVLSRQQTVDMETLLRFHNEARSAARLNHGNIAQVYYVGEDKGLPFIVSEFVEGDNLRDTVLRKGPLPLGEAVSYALQVAEALRHAAERNVVHRDIKPSNVLVTPGGQAKLIDLGLARVQSPDDSGSDLTASGVTLGTFDYISPEQARDPRIADVRSDIYSLGCTLFYMLAGRPPFPQGTVLQKLLQHQGDEPPDVRAFRPELPEEVSRVVRKMMAKDPRRRYQDPAKLTVALLSLAEQLGLRPVGLGAAAWIVPKQRTVSLLQRHLPWAAPAAVLVGVVLFLDVLWSPPGEPDDPLLPQMVGAPKELAPHRSEPSEPLPAESNGGERQLPSWPSNVAPEAPRQPETTVPSPSPVATSPAAESNPSRAPPEPPQSAEPDGAAASITKADPRDPTLESDRSLRPKSLVGRISAAEVASVGLSWGEHPEWAQGELRADVPSGAAPAGGDALPAQHRRWTVNPREPAGADFPSLSAACHAASEGDVIELRYDGRMVAKPATLPNLDITIEAGQGFQPVVAFEPSEVGPIKYPRSMFTLTGTRLTLTGVALELNVPRDVPADSWTMFEMGRSDQIRLERCSLTIRNSASASIERQAAYHPDVAFFRLKTALGSDAVLGSGPAASRGASVMLGDSIVRGEAVVLRVEDLQPVTLTWDNGLLATTEWLLVVEGGERVPQPAEKIRIQLDQLTCVVGAGLCQLNHSQFASHQLLTQIDCSRCILATPPAAPGCLVEQVGVANTEQARWELDWRSQRSFYGPFAAFWTVRWLDPDAPPMRMTFDEWQLHWTPERESSVRLDTLQWSKGPRATMPFDTHTPADYVLVDAGVAGDAGLEEARLPALPKDAAVVEQSPDSQPVN